MSERTDNVRLGNLVVEAAFDALRARLEHELGECLCKQQVLETVEEYRRRAGQAAGIVLYLRPRRLDVLRWLLLSASLAAGVVVGFILG